MWLLAKDFIELTNNNKNNKKKMMTMNHWKSFTDKKDNKKVELLRSLDNYLFTSFCNSDMTPLVSAHTINFNSDSSLIDHYNSLTHFTTTSSFSRASC